MATCKREHLQRSTNAPHSCMLFFGLQQWERPQAPSPRGNPLCYTQEYFDLRDAFKTTNTGLYPICCWRRQELNHYGTSKCTRKACNYVAAVIYGVTNFKFMLQFNLPQEIYITLFEFGLVLFLNHKQF